jgi:hypothetical protein
MNHHGPNPLNNNKCNARIEVSVIKSIGHVLAERRWTKAKDMNGSQGLAQLQRIVYPRRGYMIPHGPNPLNNMLALHSIEFYLVELIKQHLIL